MKKECQEIPEDVYEVEILAYLPARNLQILKRVSKDWLQLISSPYFVRLHQSIAYRSRVRVLIALSSAFVEYNNYEDHQDMKQIPYPPQISSKPHYMCFTRSWGSNTYIMGSVDGLVFMSDQRFDKTGMGGHGVVFNPSTGKCLQLGSRQDEYVFGYWFGKSLDGEYVLVRLVLLSPRSDVFEFRVYKLSSNTEYTHSIGDLHLPGLSFFGVFQRGTLVNGAVHWPVRRRDDNERLHFTVLVYDIHENKHWEMLPPPAAQGCYIRLGVNVDGCSLLAIVQNTSAFEVWIMKESSWTKWANLEGFNMLYICDLYPLGFFPNGDLILNVNKMKLMKYSFIHNAPTLLVEHASLIYDAIMCTDTLVSPSNSDCYC